MSAGLLHGGTLHRHMKNLQVRVDDEDIDAIDALAAETRSTRSEVARAERPARGEGEDVEGDVLVHVCYTYL